MAPSEISSSASASASGAFPIHFISRFHKLPYVGLFAPWLCQSRLSSKRLLLTLFMTTVCLTIALFSLPGVHAAELYSDDVKKAKDAAYAHLDDESYAILSSHETKNHPAWAEKVVVNIEHSDEFFKVTKQRNAIVMFKYHLCIHCKVAIGAFLDAALHFAAKHYVNEPAFAVLECNLSTELRELCESQGVVGFPTYFIYRSSEKFPILHNDRQNTTLFEIMSRIAGPLMMPLTAANLTVSGARDVEKHLEPEIVVYLPPAIANDYKQSPHASNIDAIRQIADRARVNYRVWMTSDISVFEKTAAFAKERQAKSISEPFWMVYMGEAIDDYSSDPSATLPPLDQNVPVFSIFHKNEVPIIFSDKIRDDYQYPTYLEALKEFTLRERFPLLVEANPKYFTDIMSDKRMMLYFIFSKDIKNNLSVKRQKSVYIPMMRSLARKHRQKVNAFLLDGGTYSRHLSDLNIDPVFPLMMIRHPEGTEKWILDLNKVNLATPVIENWVQNVFDKKISPSYRSDNEPTTHDPKTNVYHMNANAFTDFIKDPTRDVLMLYHISDCGDCMRFWPIYQALSKAVLDRKKELGDVGNVIISELDLAKNDLPAAASLSHVVVPLIALYPAENKPMILYSMGITNTYDTIESVIQFLKDNVHHKHLVPLPDAVDKYRSEL